MGIYVRVCVCAYIYTQILPTPSAPLEFSLRSYKIEIIVTVF